MPCRWLPGASRSGVHPRKFCEGRGQGATSGERRSRGHGPSGTATSRRVRRLEKSHEEVSRGPFGVTPFFGHEEKSHEEVSRGPFRATEFLESHEEVSRGPFTGTAFQTRSTSTARGLPRSGTATRPRIAPRLGGGLKVSHPHSEPGPHSSQEPSQVSTAAIRSEEASGSHVSCAATRGATLQHKGRQRSPERTAPNSSSSQVAFTVSRGPCGERPRRGVHRRAETRRRTRRWPEVRAQRPRSGRTARCPEVGLESLHARLLKFRGGSGSGSVELQLRTKTPP